MVLSSPNETSVLYIAKYKSYYLSDSECFATFACCTISRTPGLSIIEAHIVRLAFPYDHVTDNALIIWLSCTHYLAMVH